MSLHTNLVAAFARDEQAKLASLAPDALVVACDRRLRGPYTGMDTILSFMLPDAQARWPELVDHYRTCILETVPELTAVIGDPLRSLAHSGPFEERTRFYSRQMVRCFTQGIVTLLREYAERTRAEGRAVPVVVFERSDQADLVGQTFLALFLRRIDAGLWPAVVTGTGQVSEELAIALDRYAETVTAEATPAPVRDEATWAGSWVESDGTTDEPQALAAYLRLTAGQQQAQHDRRAAELDRQPSWGVRVAALAWHRERGSDTDAAVVALRDAAEYCTGIGLSELVIELCLRGRVLTDARSDALSYRKLSHLMLAALISTKRLAEALELAHELRRELAWPLVHMTTSYLIAMVHTRFMEPRDHETAMEWQNNALIIAQQLPDPRQRLVLTGFQENGLALIEMHRGHLDRALELIGNAMQRLDEELTPDQWALHRSQLLYNRTRLLVAMKRFDEAYEDFGTLIELDPQYTDYLSERAKLARKRGDLAAAIADYDRAEQLGAPFPETYHNRGSAYVELGETERALVDFDFVLDMEPDDVESRLSRAEVLLSLGRAVDALADTEHALLLQPGDARLICARGMATLALGRPAAAALDFDLVLGAEPGHPAALVNRAVARYELEQPAAAVADLTEAIALLGADPDLLVNRGIAYAAAGDTDRAEADFAAAASHPDADLGEIQAQRELCLAGA